jgi:hypothetical protein
VGAPRARKDGCRLFAFYNNARSILAIANTSMPCAVFDICVLEDTRGKHRIRQRLGLEGAICVRVRPQTTGKYVKNFSIHGETVPPPISRRCWICEAYHCAGFSTATVSLQPPL